MKVNIGPYKNHFIVNLSKNHMIRKYGFAKYLTMGFADYSKFDRFIEQLDDVLQYIADMTINKIERKRKIKVTIERDDILSADHTLALIILPTLEKLRENGYGSPFVDYDDVPSDLRPTEEEIDIYKKTYNLDEKFHDRWNYVLDEMIYAFTVIVSDDIYEVNENDRMKNGLCLFGKYYTNLWI